ncbi:DUF937 domain-containing protein [Tissierella creatinini]|nr:DUF937 domain-containing protein [Tissierella creatinini]TJX60559.1 DUF937 domain-containing protein [Soehngenia saccharolytica]
MDIMDLLSGQLENDKVLNQLSQTTGADASQVQQLIKLGIPTLLQSLEKNASTEQGASSLAKALDNHKDDEVDDIERFLENVDREDGAKILNHVLGNNKEKVQNNLANQTGLQTNQVLNVMSMLAPILLGTLGKQKASNNVDSSGLASMLAGILGGQAGTGGNIMGAVSKILDADGDGSIVDDIGNIFGGLFKKK